MVYTANESRYENMIYKKAGNSGLKLPLISLGLWHNFGGTDVFENSSNMVKTAFDLGITHFDLANNYGPPAGSAEETFGKIIKKDFSSHRDEMIISTKAGYVMWNGPYGDGGSKKYLISSLDQSLKRMGLDYVDIFYHHRPDSNTPLEESMAALDLIVRQGKALYVGISNYNGEQTKEAADILKKMGTPFVINQVRYSMLDRRVEKDLFNVLEEVSIGMIAFVPLAQGILTGKYLNGIREGSRAFGPSIFLNIKDITEENLCKVKKLNDIAINRGQKLSQMALAWILRNKCVTSLLIGASKPSQIEENVKTLDNLFFTKEELKVIDEILN